MMTCSAMFFVSFPKNPKIDGNDEKLTFFFFFFNLASFQPLKPTKQQKQWRCFANNRAWMIRWKVCRKDWHRSGKRPEIGLHRKISNLYKVSSVFNVCLQNKLIIISSIAKTFDIAEQSDWNRKNYLAITRQNTQEDINLLLTKTTAARCSQEAVMTSQSS